MEKNFILPATLLNEIMAYLSKRPYDEVAQGIAALAQLKEITPPEDKSKK